MIEALFPKGFTFTYGRTGWEKLSDDEFSWWVSTTSTYLVKKETETGELYHELRPESEKPLYNKEGKPNRYAFKWTDHQVKEYYGL